MSLRVHPMVDKALTTKNAGGPAVYASGTGGAPPKMDRKPRKSCIKVTQSAQDLRNLTPPSRLCEDTRRIRSQSSNHQRSDRPFLYSAIGSLENNSMSNMGSLMTRILNAQDASPASTTPVPPRPPLDSTSNNGHNSNHKQNKQTAHNPTINDENTGLVSALARAEKLSEEGLLPQEEQRQERQHLKEDSGTNRKSPRGPDRKSPQGPDIDEQEELSPSKPQSTNEAIDERRQSFPKTAVPQTQQPSSLRRKTNTHRHTKNNKKRVTLDSSVNPSQAVEMFRPSCDAYTPRIEKKRIVPFKPPLERTLPTSETMGTIQRPNFRDALRRVAMLLHQHISKIERRPVTNNQGLFHSDMKDAFSEDVFITPRYTVCMARIPMALPGIIAGMKKIKIKYEIPSAKEIYEFAHKLFKKVQLSSECSIVCLIYVERIMESAKVPLLASTWRPVVMCGLLLASKVWQDLSSWNIEFASVYPQYSLESINRLEHLFLKHIKWNLYISSSLYAKYYFALRSLLEKKDFRQRYNRMVGGVDSVAASTAIKVSKRTEELKEEALLQLSQSM